MSSTQTQYKIDFETQFDMRHRRIIGVWRKDSITTHSLDWLNTYLVNDDYRNFKVAKRITTYSDWEEIPEKEYKPVTITKEQLETENGNLLRQKVRDAALIEELRKDKEGLIKIIEFYQKVIIDSLPDPLLK